MVDDSINVFQNLKIKPDVIVTVPWESQLKCVAHNTGARLIICHPCPYSRFPTLPTLWIQHDLILKLWNKATNTIKMGMFSVTEKELNAVQPINVMLFSASIYKQYHEPDQQQYIWLGSLSVYDNFNNTLT